MIDDEVHKLRRTVKNYRGLRKIRAEAALVEKLVRIDNKEALQLAEDTVSRARELLQSAKDRNKSLASYERSLAWILRSQAYVLLTVECFTDAEHVLSEAIGLFDQADEGRELIKCNQLLHILFREQLQYDQALDALAHALEIGRRIGYHAEDAFIHGAQASLFALLGRVDDAIRFFEKGLKIAGELDDRHAEIMLLNGLGLACEDFGKPERAFQSYRQAAALERRFKVRGNRSLSMILGNLARLCFCSGDLRQAADLFAEAVTVSHAGKLIPLEAYFLTQSARVLTCSAEYEAALACLHRGLSLHESRGNDAGLAWCLALKGGLFAGIGEAETAARQFAESCRLLESFSANYYDESNYVILAATVLAHYQCDDVDVASFAEFFHKDQSDSRLDPASLTIMLLRLGIAYLADMRNDHAAARREYRAVLELSRKLRYRFLQVEALYALGRSLARNGEFNRSNEMLAEALSTADEIAARDYRRRILLLSADNFEMTGQAQKAQEYRDKLATLDQDVLSSQIRLSLKLQHETSVNKKLEDENSRLEQKLKETQSQHSTLKRLLETKDTQISHLRDTLQELAESLAYAPDESEQTYRLRAAQLGKNVSAALEDADWTEYEREVQQQDEEILLRLSKLCPSLTATERKVCALMRLNHSTKELSRLLNLSPRSVQAYRYRIRKKLGVASEADLNVVVMELLNAPD